MLMKASEVRELTLEELRQREEDVSEELFNLKFQLATAQLENKMRVRQVRRDLARIKTIMREKQAQ
jgi:large subunit ribosomal protein L29